MLCCANAIQDCLPSSRYGRVAAKFLLNELVALYETLPSSLFWSATFWLVKVFPLLEVDSVAYTAGVLGLVQWLLYALKIYLIESPEYAWNRRAIMAPIVHALPDAAGDAAFVITNWLGNKYLEADWFGNFMQKQAVVATGDMLGTFLVSAFIRLIITNCAWDDRDKRPFLPSAILTGILSLIFTVIEAAMLGDPADVKEDYDWWTRTFSIWGAMIPVASILIWYFTPAIELEEARKGTTGPTLATPLPETPSDGKSKGRAPKQRRHAIVSNPGAFRAAAPVQATLIEQQAGSRWHRVRGAIAAGGLRQKLREADLRGEEDLSEPTGTRNPLSTATASASNSYGATDTSGDAEGGLTRS